MKITTRITMKSTIKIKTRIDHKGNAASQVLLFLVLLLLFEILIFILLFLLFASRSSRPLCLWSYGLEQVADLLVDLRRIVERGGDLVLEDRAVTFLEPMDGGMDCSLARAEPLGQRRARHGPLAFGQDDLEMREELRSAGFRVLVGEELEDTAEQRDGPGAVEQPVRRHGVSGFVKVSTLGVLRVDRDQGSTTSALQRLLVAVLINQEMLAVGTKEGAEASLATVSGREHALLQQPGEIALGQVERLLGVVPFPTNERIDGIPVRGSQLGQRGPGVRRRQIGCCDDPAPSSRGERRSLSL